jgi:hypothetical protein
VPPSHGGHRDLGVRVRVRVRVRLRLERVDEWESEQELLCYVMVPLLHTHQEQEPRRNSGRASPDVSDPARANERGGILTPR